MQLALRIGIGIVVLAAAGYALFYFVGQTPAPSVQNIAATSTEIRIVAKEYEEEGARYRIQMRYPSIGIAQVDQQIEAELRVSAEDLKKQAVEDAVSFPDIPPYEYIADYDQKEIYVSDDVISIPVTQYWYTGGAHGMPGRFVYNYDRRTLRELTLNDALAMIGLSLEKVAAQSLVQLKTQFGEDGLLSEEGAAAQPDNYATFRVDADAVIFIFQPYQVAAYAAGMPEVSFKRVK